MKKEIKLVFPKPPDAPDGSFFYVYRRIIDIDGTPIFQTIDHAFTEGQGDSSKVVTASPPFSGYSDSFGGISAIAGAVGGFVIDSLADQYFYLEWSFDRFLLGVASQDLIVGKVLRTIPPKSGEVNPTFEPIPGAIAWRTADTQHKTIAKSDSTGVFSLFPGSRGPQTIRITVKLPTGEEQQADVFVENTAQPDDGQYGILPDLYRSYQNVARATITFAPARPIPPAPQIDIRIFTHDSSNRRTEISGLVPTGTPLTIGVASTTDPNLDIQSLSVNGQSVSFGQDIGTPKMIVSTSADYVPSQAGTYTASATGLSPFGGPGVTVSKNFRVLAAGESNSNPDQLNPPTVVSVVPVSHAQRISPTTFIQVVFSEPVTHVPGNILLVDDHNKPVDFTLLAVGRADSSGSSPVFDNLQDSSAVVTAITLQPKSTLKFDTTYTLSVSSAITDVDTSPKPLVFFSSQFTTVAIQGLATPDDVFPSPRVVVLGNAAYAVKQLGDNGSLEVYSTKDPAVLQSISSTPVEGRPSDIAGEIDSRLGGLGSYVVVSTGVSAWPKPSDLWVYDVSNPAAPNRIGAVGMTGDATQQGTVLRFVVKDGVAYSATFFQGVQVVDLSEVVKQFQADIQAIANPGGGASFLIDQIFGKLANVSDGNSGYNNNLVKTIPVMRDIGGGLFAHVTLFDLDVGDYVLPGGQAARLVVATGHNGLTVVDPTQQSVLFQNTLTGNSAAPGHLENGFAVALSTINQTPMAAVIGTGTGVDPDTGTSADGWLLALVDLTDPTNPKPLSFMAVNGTATDVQINNNLAFLAVVQPDGQSGTLLVDLSNLAAPKIVSPLIPSVSGRLTLVNGSTIFSTGFGPSQGGIHSALIGSACGALRDSLAAQSVPAQLKINKQLDWSFNATVSPNDGFVLTDVTLGRRHMANKMSVPYFNINYLRRDTNQTIPARCELSPDSSANGYVGGDVTNPINAPRACDVLLQSRSRLVDFKNIPSDGKTFALEATYLVDRLDGNPEDPTTPNVPDSCVLITQRYQFEKESLRPFEPNGALPTGKFFPTVEYKYFSDNAQLNSITIPQRMYFDARDINDHPTAKAPSNAVLMTCDSDHPVGSPTQCTGTLGVGILHGQNPLQQEVSVRAIEAGQTKVFSDFALRNVILAINGGIFQSVDNFHQSPQPLVDPSDPGNPAAANAIQNQSVDLPGFGFPGCPGCVHIHWRWGAFLDPDSFLGATFLVDKDFNNNQGKLFIPGGSNQDVDIAIVQARANEEHPLDFTALANSESLKPSDNPQPVFWYAGTGHLPSDRFFIHGGGFSSLYVNRLTTSFSGPITFNIEHSHDVSWSVQVYGITTDILNGDIFSLKDFEVGTLSETADDFTLNTSVTKPYAVFVVLMDSVTGAKSSNYFIFKAPVSQIREP
jgi:hypothetical protein